MGSTPAFATCAELTSSRAWDLALTFVIAAAPAFHVRPGRGRLAARGQATEFKRRGRKHRAGIGVRPGRCPATPIADRQRELSRAAARPRVQNAFATCAELTPFRAARSQTRWLSVLAAGQLG